MISLPICTLFNPYPAEFFKCTCPLSIFGTIHFQFRDIKMTYAVGWPTGQSGQTAQMYRLTLFYKGGKS